MKVCAGLRTIGSALVGLAFLSLVGAAAGQAPPPTLDLSTSRQIGADGRSFVNVRLATNSNGYETNVTAFRQPGERTCVSDPRLRWPKGANQLLFAFSPHPANKWDPVVRYAVTSRGTWTICGYVVNEGNTRFGEPYVVATTRTVVHNVSPRKGAPHPGSGPWTRCATTTTQKVDSLAVRSRRPAGTCGEARSISRQWETIFRRDGGGARNNWGFGWMGPNGSTQQINTPPVRFSTIQRGNRRIDCRETFRGASLWAPLTVDCGMVRFRFPLR